MFCENIIALKDKLAPYTTGTLVVLAGEKGFSYASLQPILQEAKVPIIGAFFPGLIAENELHYSGFLLLHFRSEAEVYLFDSKDISSIKFRDSAIKQRTSLVLLDGLASENQAFLNALYYELGQNIKFIGGGAGSLDLIQKPCVFDAQGIYQNKALVLLIKSKVAIGIQHGYTRLAGPMIATATKANKVAELNWENAYDCYSDAVNDDSSIPITKEDFFNIAKGYPLGISRKGHEDIVRDPISVDEDGVLNCIDDVPENAALYILKGEPEKLLEAAVASCNDAVGQVDGEVEQCLFIDCVSRVLYLGDEFSKEIKAATNAIHSKYPKLHAKGILSLGEISTYKDGKLELYNKTFLTTLVYDK